MTRNDKQFIAFVITFVAIVCFIHDNQRGRTERVLSVQEHNIFQAARNDIATPGP